MLRAGTQFREFPTSQVLPLTIVSTPAPKLRHRTPGTEPGANRRRTVGLPARRADRCWLHHHFGSDPEV